VSKEWPLLQAISSPEQLRTIRRRQHRQAPWNRPSRDRLPGRHRLAPPVHSSQRRRQRRREERQFGKGGQLVPKDRRKVVGRL
jgi:hypothetical protein